MNSLMIDYFMAVASNLSFTKTSEELYVSQPAISKQISQLEKELGAKLFTRNNKKTELTDAGRLYYDFFVKYKAEFINTKMEAERLLDCKKGIIRIGFLEGWDLAGIIPPMIKQFKSEYPESDIIIDCCGIKELSSGLLKGNLDIAVTFRNSINMYKELECTDVKEIEKILLFSSNHSMADTPSDRLSLNDFSKDSFIAPWPILDNMVSEAISSYTRPYGFIPKITFVKNHESMITCVRNNMGVAVVDEWAWARNADDIRWIKFDFKDVVSVARASANTSECVLAAEKILKNVIANS